MRKIDFYTGFEPYAEYKIFQKDKTGETNVLLSLWEGYFYTIMDLIEPNKEGKWEGLILHYHCDLAWGDIPSKCEDLELFLSQLKLIDKSILTAKEGEILLILILMINDCLAMGDELFFLRD